MTTARQFLLTDATGPGRIPTLLAALGHIPMNGRPYTIEQMEVMAGIKQAVWGITQAKGEMERLYLGGDQTMTLTTGQIELLRERITSFPFWNPLKLDEVAETYRWLGLSGTETP